MRQLFLFLIIIALFIRPVNVHAENINCEIYIITAPVALNLREGPGTNYKVVTSAKGGDKVVAYEATPAANGKIWYRVKFKKYTGWASSTYLKTTGQFSSDCNQNIQPGATKITDQPSTNIFALFTPDGSRNLVIGMVMMVAVILVFIVVVYIIKAIFPAIRKVVLPIILIAGAGYVAIRLIDIFYGSSSGSDKVINNPITVQSVTDIGHIPLEPFYGLALFIFIVGMFIVAGMSLSPLASFSKGGKKVKTVQTTAITLFFTALLLLFMTLFILAIYFQIPSIIFGQFFWVFLVHILNSIVTFILYAYDKSVAEKNDKDKNQTGGKNEIMRIPEAVLLFSEVLGGWPGGLIARPVLNHKTNWERKKNFIMMSWLIIFVHLAFWVWYFFLK